MPAFEERRCARHILANWSKNWRGLQRKKQFWKCARSTFEAEFRENLHELSKLGTGGIGIVDDLKNIGVRCILIVKSSLMQ